MSKLFFRQQWLLDCLSKIALLRMKLKHILQIYERVCLYLKTADRNSSLNLFKDWVAYIIEEVQFKSTHLKMFDSICWKVKFPTNFRSYEMHETQKSFLVWGKLLVLQLFHSKSFQVESAISRQVTNFCFNRESVVI